ncbi:hypothetical protein AVEN_144153-1 [Araneus ventricosus]|uniref:Mos1 transposase HTH domain-containing protein n=1 Tax=Araneus ventricosus TaxID=182803 RepID=A0A4Y2IC82_ARAVE|nr:hypothetical protein AVEN_144153-1 [Araneus ventricosus]
MTDGMVRKWVRQFNDGRTNVHDEARSGRPFVINDGLVAKMNEKIRENRRFTIRMLFDEFPQISKTVLHEIVTNRLNYSKLCSRWVPKMFTDVHKTKRLGSALKFLTRCSEEGNEFLNKIVTGNETWHYHQNKQHHTNSFGRHSFISEHLKARKVDGGEQKSTKEMEETDEKDALRLIRAASPSY